MYKCKYCNKKFSKYGIKGHIWISHTEEGKKHYLKINYVGKGKLKRIKIKRICPRCNQEFIIEERIKRDGSISDTSKKFCSSKCSHSKIVTKKTRDKISLSMRKKLLNNFWSVNIYCNKCIICNRIFVTKNKNRKICSYSCFCKIEKHRKILSNAIKEQYKKGKKVYGGTTKWIKYNEIKVQGTYEYRTCIILDKWKELKIIKDWDYTNDRVEYIGEDGKVHYYLIDFKIFNNDFSWYYLEIKGYKTHKDELKWKAVRNKGYKIKIWFEKNIKKEENKLKIKMEE
jgi:hypothetical protein